MMRLEGPAVRELDAVFATDWYSETDVLLSLEYGRMVHNQGSALFDAQVLPSGPSFDNDNNLKLYATHPQSRTPCQHHQSLLRAGRIHHDGHRHCGRAWTQR